MRIWIYGSSPEEVQRAQELWARTGVSIAGTSLCAGPGARFPCSGLTPALWAAARGQLDRLILAGTGLPGGKRQAAELTALFSGYGVSVKSCSSWESSSS